MNTRGIQRLLFLAGMVMVVGLACGALSTTTTTGPSPAAPSAAPAQTESVQPTEASASAGLVTFTDQNKYFAIDLPSDWTHSQDVDKQNNYWYQDTFKSPDGNARVDSIVYNDGTPWSGSQNGAFALQLLNQYYSNTGKEGDIRVSGDSIQKDGSERLDWASKGGSYSGESFFEIRNRMAFLMLTIMWDNNAADKYQKTLDDIVGSYRLP